MDAGQHDDRTAGLDELDTPGRDEVGKIELAAQKRVVLPASRRLDIADIGEALRPQQLLGHVFGCNADAVVVRQSDGRRFESVLSGQRSRQTEQVRRAGQ